MKSSSIFTKRKMGLDINVLLVMAIISFLSLGLLAYRYTDKTPKKHCGSLKITINGKTSNGDNGTVTNSLDTFSVGEDLLFSTSPSSSTDITWRVGGKTYKKDGIYFYHRFMSAGKYNIEATYDGDCSNKTAIYIKKLAPVKENNIVDAISSLIMGSENIIARTSQKYSFDSVCNFYEWIIVDHPYFETKNTKEVTFKFPAEGTYRIQLTLDHDRAKRGYKEIIVTEPEKIDAGYGNFKPERRKGLDSVIITPPEKKDTAAVVIVPKPPVVETAEIVPLKTNNETLKSYLIDVVNNKKTAEEFNRYFIYKEKTSVRKVFQKSTVNFGEFYREIAGKGVRQIRIESVEQVFEGGDPTKVAEIKVKYKKKGFAGIIWGN